MVKCPFCGEELEHVEVECYEKCFMLYKVYPDNDPRFPHLSNLVWEEDERESVDGSEMKEVSCPYCHATLPLKDEDEIEEFFEGTLVVTPLNDPRIRVLNERRVLFKGKLYELRRIHELVRDFDGIVREPFSYDGAERRFTVLVLSEI